MSTNQAHGSIGRRRAATCGAAGGRRVTRTQSGITLLADMPGVPKDRLELKVEADTLSIEGQVVHADAGRPGSGVRRSARAALPPHVHAQPRARHVEGRCQPERRRADAAHPEAGARATAPHRRAGRLTPRSPPTYGPTQVGPFFRAGQPPPMPCTTWPVPPQVGHIEPAILPLPPQRWQGASPVPGVPGAASSPASRAAPGSSSPATDGFGGLRVAVGVRVACCAAWRASCAG